MTDEALVATMERLRRELTPGDLDHTLGRITAAAVEVIPDVTYASVTVRHADGSLQTFAPTDTMLLGVDAAQYELREGPCYEAASDTVHVVSPDLAADERFPRYSAMAVQAGIAAQVGVRLYESPRANGALNLYSTRRGAFGDLDTLRDLFVHQSATAISYAHEIGDLREAMQARRTIGQAIGIVMERYELTDERAFAFLARLSSHRNVKLRLVAQEIVAEAEQQGARS